MIDKRVLAIIATAAICIGIITFVAMKHADLTADAVDPGLSHTEAEVSGDNAPHSPIEIKTRDTDRQQADIEPKATTASRDNIRSAHGQAQFERLITKIYEETE